MKTEQMWDGVSPAAHDYGEIRKYAIHPQVNKGRQPRALISAALCPKFRLSLAATSLTGFECTDPSDWWIAVLPARPQSVERGCP